MRRAGGLWADVTEFENLYRAAYRVLRGKRSQAGAGDFFRELEGNLFRLQAELSSQAYHPGAYRTFWIRDPKARLISAAPIRDRIVHQALVTAIEPVFERRFIHDSYACRVGRGTHRALRRFVGWARASRWVLKMDVRKFFPSVDHELLKWQLRRVVKDRQVLELCDLIIDSSNPQEELTHHFVGDDLFTPLERRRGIPIGNLTSQFFANVYLDPLDHFVKERLKVRRYLRYVDDFCCFGDDKGRLWAWRNEIVEYLARWRLRLNERKSRVRQVKEGIEFLGFVVHPHTLRLNATGVRRQRRRVRNLQTAYARGEYEWPEIQASLRSWNAHAAHGSTRRLRRDVFTRAKFTRHRES